jgi:tetratricopeptide (TPR) repeat protein
VVRGAYQRVGQIVRITANFGEVRTGRLLKTVKVDGKIEEIFQLQDKIVYGLMQGIDLKLEDTEIARIESQETKSVEAYESCSRGMLSLRTGDRDALDRAISLFEKAIGLDPQYASAWAGLASANCLKGMFLGPPDYLERAVAHARRAIAIRPGLASAHAWARLRAERIGAAGGGHRRDLRGAPHRGRRTRRPIHILARAYWVGLGRIDEGILELEKSIELNPEFGYCYLQLAFLHALKRDLPRAEAAARKAVRAAGKGDLRGRRAAHRRRLLTFGLRLLLERGLRRRHREYER